MNKTDVAYVSAVILLGLICCISNEVFIKTAAGLLLLLLFMLNVIVEAFTHPIR